MSTWFSWKRGLAAVVAALSLSVSAGLAAEGDQPSLLFVTTAESLSYDQAASTITLSAVAPQVIWFTDRPYRKAGHLSLAQFMDGWDEGADSFAADPPNVVVTYEGQAGEPVIAELMNPSLEGSSVTFEIALLQGDLPASGDKATVVFDNKPGCFPTPQFCHGHGDP